MKALVVDDEDAVRTSIARALKANGYDIAEASSGDEALVALGRQPPDLLVLDVLMPGRDGISVVRELRAQRNSLPVLIVSARDEVDARVAGLDAGADDYLVKPFALAELLARARALTRRHDALDGETLVFQDLRLDPAARQCRRGDRPIELTRTEFSLLEVLMRNPRSVVSRSKIFTSVWDYDFGYASNSLDVYIGYLRNKTEAGGESRLIHTKRGVGYMLGEPA